MCRSVFQRVAVCSIFSQVAENYKVGTVCVLECVGVCLSVLQCVLQCVPFLVTLLRITKSGLCVCCSVLEYVAV